MRKQNGKAHIEPYGGINCPCCRKHRTTAADMKKLSKEQERREIKEDTKNSLTEETK